MAVALSMEGSFGFGLQESKGTYVSPTTWLPLLDGDGKGGDSVSWKKNYVVLDMADGKEYQTSYYSAGEWAEGELRFPLIPGSLSALFSWLRDRDAENQGKWASVLVDCVNEVKRVTDVKARRARLDFVRGEPIVCTLDVCGLKMDTGSPVTPSFPVAAPYLFSEVTVEIANGGEGLAEDINCERLRIELDNMVEDAEEGLRLAESGEPLQLYNLAGVRCTGVLSRDFVDSAVYGDFAAGQEAAVLITLERGAATATVALPRVLYTGSDAGLPGSHSKRIVEQVEFTGLASADGLTPPVVLA